MIKKKMKSSMQTIIFQLACRIVLLNYYVITGVKLKHGWNPNFGLFITSFSPYRKDFGRKQGNHWRRYWFINMNTGKNFRHDRGWGLSWVSFHFDLKELSYISTSGTAVHGVKLNLRVTSLSENVSTKRRKNLGKNKVDWKENLKMIWCEWIDVVTGWKMA